MAIIFAATEPGHLDAPSSMIETFTPYDPLYCRQGVRGFWGNVGGTNLQETTKIITLPQSTSTFQDIYICGHFVDTYSGTSAGANGMLVVLTDTQSLYAVGLQFTGNQVVATIINNSTIRSTTPAVLSAGLHKVVAKIQYRGTGPYNYTAELHVDDAFIGSTAQSMYGFPTNFNLMFLSDDASMPRNTFTASELIVSTTDPSRMQLWTRVPQSIPLIDSNKWFGTAADINEMVTDNTTYMQCLDNTEPYYAVQMTQPAQLPIQKPIAYVTHITTDKMDDAVPPVGDPYNVRFGTVDAGFAQMKLVQPEMVVDTNFWRSDFQVLNDPITDTDERVVLVGAYNNGSGTIPIDYP